MSDAILHFTINPANSGCLHVFINHVDQGYVCGTYDLPVNIGDYFEMYANPASGFSFDHYVQPDGSITSDSGFAVTIGTSGIKNIGAYFKSVAPQPCTIQAAFFAKNGSPMPRASCSAGQNDRISAALTATFSGSAIGQSYSAMMQVKRPDGTVAAIVSPYISVTATTTFYFGDWAAPIPVGAYTIEGASIADINGNLICSGFPSGGFCQALTITPAVSTLTTITVSPAWATVGAGGATQLTAACKDQVGQAMTCPPSLAWSSDNPSVAAVDAFTGKVTGVSAGTANITAYSGTIVSNKSVITVSPSAPALTTITISPASATIGAGGAKQLTAVCIDQNGATMTCPQLIWTSDNFSVANVNEFTGFVNGVSAGTANITASYGTIVSNKSVITVSEAAPTLTTISISPASASPGIGATQQMTATCIDQNGKAMPSCSQIYWVSDNPGVASVDPFTGIVSGISAGTANITAFFGAIVSNKSVMTVPGTGTLEISSTPAGAEVILDGRDQGAVTPAALTSIPSGSHPYKLVLSGYKDTAGTVTIEAGKTTVLAVTLEKEGGLSASTAIGLAVVITVVAVGAVLAGR